MAAFFFDSSALAKNYIAETGTAWVQSIIALPVNRIFVARITLVELVSAITRRTRSGNLTSSAATQALADVRTDFKDLYEIIAINRRLIRHAEQAAEKHGLRAYDAVQLAAAQQVNQAYISRGLPSVPFICADNQLNIAATVEGLSIDDPNSH